MRKLLLTFGLMITALNLTLGIAYSAVCEATSGERHCGTTCATQPGGGCTCNGGCSSDEQRWVDSGKKQIADEEMLIS